MSLLSEFNADCPLTITKLESWLRQLIGKSDEEFEIQKSFLVSLYSKTQGSSITSQSMISTINDIVDAIDAGKALKCANGNISILASRCKCVTSDNYESFELYAIGPFDSDKLEKVTLGVENISGAVRLYEKTVTDV